MAFVTREANFIGSSRCDLNTLRLRGLLDSRTAPYYKEGLAQIAGRLVDLDSGKKDANYKANTMYAA